MIVDTYTLTIELDEDADPVFFGDMMLLRLQSALREGEENITDLLPDGYRAVITHWTGSEET